MTGFLLFFLKKNENVGFLRNHDCPTILTHLETVKMAQLRAKRTKYSNLTNKTYQMKKKNQISHISLSDVLIIFNEEPGL